MTVRVLTGDCRSLLRTLPDQSVQMAVTSPPYYGLRDYGVAGQIGLERSMHDFIGELVAVFSEVRRALRDDGTLWLNIGDSYAANRGSGAKGIGAKQATNVGANLGSLRVPDGLKEKDLIGIPWRIAFALQADGWYLRQDIIWSKPNPMPESVRDRCTKAHEYIFLLSKSSRYYYDAQAIAEPAINAGRVVEYDGTQKNCEAAQDERMRTRVAGNRTVGDHRNRRSVWEVATQPFSEAHFATFPTEIPRRAILAGSHPGDTILDPFGGAGTTGLVADRLQRNAILVELNPQYAEMARRRIYGDAPLFAEVDGG